MDEANGWAKLSAIAALVAAGGTVLLLLGISPGHVSAREPGFDQLINHLKFYGPPWLLGCLAWIGARPKLPVGLWLLACTLLYLLGFFLIR